ncbi:MAG: hypothetical protein M3162_08520 [Thermoproteota archaeon]|nr:hypothetical protein [Thermoproteota archaeon]
MSSYLTHSDKVIMLEKEEFEAFLEYEKKEIDKNEQENLAASLEFFNAHFNE